MRYKEILSKPLQDDVRLAVQITGEQLFVLRKITGYFDDYFRIDHNTPYFTKVYAQSVTTS